MKLKNTVTVSALVLTTSFSSVYSHEHKNGEHSKQKTAPTITEPVKTGSGKYTYLASPTWGNLKDGKNLGPTHGGVVVDQSGLIYISTDGEPSVFVFKPDGSLVKTMAPQARGMHQMVIREENGKEYIYGAQLNAYGGQRIEKIIKLDLEGKTVLEIPNAKTGKIPGGVSGMTGVAVAPDGSIFCSIGYGSNKIHKFTKDGELIKTFGGRGAAQDQFKTPHNLAIDLRFGAPRLLVVDREKRRLLHFDLDGNFIGVHAKDLRRPCAVSFHGDICAVAELESRVTILDKSGKHVAYLGDNPNKKQWANMKVKPSEQKVGIFSAAHGISFDKQGNLYVQDWNVSGRATQLLLIKE